MSSSLLQLERKKIAKERDLICLNLPSTTSIAYQILDLIEQTLVICYSYSRVGGKLFFPSTTKCLKALPKEAEWDCLKRTTATKIGESGGWVKRKIQTTCWFLVASVTVQEVEEHEGNACQSTSAGSSMASFTDLVVSASSDPMNINHKQNKILGNLHRNLYSTVLCSNVLKFCRSLYKLSTQNEKQKQLLFMSLRCSRTKGHLHICPSRR